MTEAQARPPQNRLRDEVSPYLRAHADNPVAWWPWGPAALAEARRTGKPILLSIGYSACHWCHVMAHESFEDPSTADLMNRLFINIKVDREERPDIDQLYMAALHALGEPGGWPLTMFLTPDAEPVWGGTYFPPTARYGRPAFAEVLRDVAETFAADPARIDQNRRALAGRLAEGAASAGHGLAPTPALLRAAAERLASLMDPDAGGVRGAPKFPQAMLLSFLWRAADYGIAADCRRLVSTTLEKIARGGIYDHVGGGMARYSVDDRWLVPHFEKMLYDNAQFVALLTAATNAAPPPLFRRRIDETLAWMLRDLRMPEGAFAAALDADTPEGEGHFYTWTRAELDAVLGDDAAAFAGAYDIAAAGNWEGRSIPNLLAGPPPPAADPFADQRAKLRAHREAVRAHPARDDKILADWNGLAIAALAKAAWHLGQPAWLDAAIRAYRFVADSMLTGGRLRHSFCAGRLGDVGLASDLAAMAHAALALFTVTQNGAYLDDARRAVADLNAHHRAPGDAGFLLAPDDGEALVHRLAANADEATPSATALALDAMIRLYHLTGERAHLSDSDAMLAALAPSIGENLFAGAGLLCALDLRLYAVSLVVIVPKTGDAEPLLAPIRAAWSERFVLRVMEAVSELPPGHPAAGKGVVAGRPTLYICRGETCSLPVSDPADAARHIAAAATIPG